MATSVMYQREKSIFSIVTDNDPNLPEAISEQPAVVSEDERSIILKPLESKDNPTDARHTVITHQTN
ncbi:hypothetical protein ES702_02599 [subsurface metagenome]